MEYKAEIKYIKIGPRKMREVADVVRGKLVDEALSNLDYLKKNAAKYLAKSLRSAVAGAVKTHSAQENLLVVKLLEINKGPDSKRWRPVSRGMSHPYVKRSSHIKIVLSEKPKPKPKPVKLIKKVKKVVTI
ncbi:50S ribosomal protein L22 [Candidatus Roizmanbacteria bacterium CG22_combo_CG10-13_8_21_14_all_38_20]|uniref:Large ribosomal subunit protein uL22 n=1 Tax=Candidatus Roizmanbacteria bacterium CG22_combo_CG10-13_8_21_14_all_38_20 TaxID=1974862 RepID=A0A2H0BXA1_9BACT|nr:50S ribosomal protein L22 [Candidatus Microgenomates bacterium]PIP62159.1 MAG: 50S ribosomal protein L22 [Candidatus Roizmanbacteria bacterium CG22_combo_CG10-13_8_21_14_all_38_20]PJC30903.1 MAG: 50S ribosomal protein L22 [Candidatus Roizmanbacteria bacterium CG_4_9_14_0_2_um_filter_38_17]